MKFRNVVLAAAVIALPLSAHASPNLLSNGDFSSYTTNASVPNSAVNPNFEFSQSAAGNLTNWTSSYSTTTGSSGAYNLLFHTSNATTSNAYGQYSGSNLEYLAAAFPGSTPDHATTFVALDGDTQVNGYLTQSVAGLTAGASYDVSFSWAGTQLASRTGQTTEQLAVSLGNLTTYGNNTTQLTSVVTTPSQGFTGWFTSTFTFTAGSGTNYLSFLSLGTPNGAPPVTLLSGVSLTAHAVTATVPEPSTWAMLLTGFGALAFLARRRRGGASDIA